MCLIRSFVLISLVVAMHALVFLCDTATLFLVVVLGLVAASALRWPPDPDGDDEDEPKFRTHWHTRPRGMHSLRVGKMSSPNDDWLEGM